jgi:hypothetical protein
VCVCVCVFDIFVPTAALINEPPRLLETITYGHHYQPVHTVRDRNSAHHLLTFIPLEPDNEPPDKPPETFPKTLPDDPPGDPLDEPLDEPPEPGEGRRGLT